MKENKLVDLSVDFAIKIIKLCETIKGHYSLVNQLERSATSIGANIHEAQYAQSTKDFISKLEIALKECNESEYWLELLCGVHSITTAEYEKYHRDCIALRRMLVASVTTLKNKIAQE